MSGYWHAIEAEAFGYESEWADISISEYREPKPARFAGENLKAVNDAWEFRQMEPSMSHQNNYANQRPIAVRCKCGWHGKSPTDLVENMANKELLCPACFSTFYPNPSGK